MTDRLDLPVRYRRVVEALLTEHVPDTEVWAYGSRIKGSSHAASDLDLVLRSRTLAPIPAGRLNGLEEALEESNIPILVQTLDWASLPSSFHEEIKRQYLVLQGISSQSTPEWPLARLGDCAVMVRDKVSPTDCGDTPYIGLEHIQEGTLNLNGSDLASSVTSVKSRFRTGDILFGKLRPYFRKVIRARFDGICSTDIWVLRPSNGVDAGYLFYVMASTAVVNAATLGSEGTRMPRAKWEHVSSIEIPLPPIDQQRAIARVLGALDDKIELNRQMSKTLEDIAQALFKSWFVDFDPVHAKAEGRSSGAGLPSHLDALFPDSFSPSELGPIPHGWRITRLDELAVFLNGLALQKYPPTTRQSLPIIKIAQLRSGRLVGADLASSEIDPKYIVEDGDVLFSWSGSLECRLWAGGTGALNQHLFKVIPNTDVPKWLSYFAIHTHLADFRAIAAGKATTMGHIQRHHLSDALQAAPSQDTVASLDRVIGPIVDRLVASMTEVGRLASQRDALLPELLSGQVQLRSR